MKKFLLKVLVFAVCFFIAEKVFYIFIYVSPGLEKDKRLEKVVTGHMDKDVIILGSSRGARGILASRIEEKTGLSAYNLSYPGSNVEFHEFLLRALLEFNTAPRTVLLVVDDPVELLPAEALTFRLDRLYPLAKYDFINREMIRRGEKNYLSWGFALARINQRNFDLRPQRFTKLDSISIAGSMPITFQRNEELSYKKTDYIYPVKDELDAKREAFQQIDEHCLNNGIKLIVVFPPNLIEHNVSVENRLRALSSSNTDIFVYDTSSFAYKKKSYYYDNSHLKKNGAEVFTDEIITYLQEDLLLTKHQ
jgi:hypothetical protein